MPCGQSLCVSFYRRILPVPKNIAWNMIAIRFEHNDFPSGIKGNYFVTTDKNGVWYAFSCNTDLDKFRMSSMCIVGECVPCVAVRDLWWFRSSDLNIYWILKPKGGNCGNVLLRSPAKGK